MPNGLGQSHIGVKGKEPIASDWSLVFKFENGFDPFTLQRANGPKSLVQNNTTPLDAANRKRRFESRRATVQHRGLRRVQPSDVRHADRRPPELPDLAGSGRLRRHGRGARLLGDRRLEHRRRRRRHRERPLQHIGEIRRRRRSAPLRGALSVRRLRSRQRFKRRVLDRSRSALRRLLVRRSWARR